MSLIAQYVPSLVHPDAPVFIDAPGGSGGGTATTNASLLTSGTLPAARLTGAYTGITAIGSQSTLTVSGLGSLGSLNVTGAVGIGTITPGASVEIAREQVAAELWGTLYHTSAGSSFGIVLNRARGTLAAPGALSSGDELGGIFVRGHDGTSFGNRIAGIIFNATEAFTGANNHGSSMAFFTSANGSGSRTQRMLIDQNGAVGIGLAPTSRLHVYLDATLLYTTAIERVTFGTKIMWGNLDASSNAALWMGAVAVTTPSASNFTLASNGAALTLNSSSSILFTKANIGQMTIGLTAAGIVDIPLGFLTWSGQKRVTTQFDSNGTTLANVTGLSVTLVAAQVYYFRAVLDIAATAIGGSKFAIAGTATATSIFYWIQLADGSTNAFTINSRQNALAGAAGQAGTLTGKCTIEGLIVVNGAGTLTVQFAQNAANGTSSVLVGSHLVCNKIT